jgi:hypothetical protein
VLRALGSYMKRTACFEATCRILCQVIVSIIINLAKLGGRIVQERRNIEHCNIEGSELTNEARRIIIASAKIQCLIDLNS